MGRNPLVLLTLSCLLIFSPVDNFGKRKIREIKNKSVNFRLDLEGVGCVALQAGTCTAYDYSFSLCLYLIVLFETTYTLIFLMKTVRQSRRKLKKNNFDNSCFILLMRAQPNNF